MNILTLLLIALSLSFDSFAVSVSSGMSMCRRHMKLSQTLRIAASLAIFQGFMPLLGWVLGEAFHTQMMKADHWIAFGLLLFLGLKMIWEGRDPASNRKIKNPSHWKVLIPISLATSVDAFAMGIGFSLFVEKIVLPVLLIALVTFMVSLFGIYTGRKLGKRIAGTAEILGGIILIIIGSKILIEQLYFQ